MAFSGLDKLKEHFFFPLKPNHFVILSILAKANIFYYLQEDLT